MKPVNDFFMAGISALSFYQCFDTVGYMTFCLQKIHHLNVLFQNE